MDLTVGHKAAPALAIRNRDCDGRIEVREHQVAAAVGTIARVGSMRLLRTALLAALLLTLGVTTATAAPETSTSAQADTGQASAAEVGAAAIARTRIQGWSSSSVTVPYGTLVKQKIRVKTGKRYTKRKLRIQYREVVTGGWNTYKTGRTNKAGKYTAKMKPDDGSWDFRVSVLKDKKGKSAKSKAKRIHVPYTKWEQVSAGHAHTCALTDAGKAFCWGNNTYGQLGTGSTASSATTPTAVDTSGVLAGKRLVEISAGGSASRSHTCARDSDGQLYCWGDNYFRQLGDGGTALSRVPVRADYVALAGHTFSTISAGGQHSCAVDSTGAPYCWGAGANGQLGNGATPLSSDPVAVATATSFRSASAGLGQTCGVTTANENYCWGNGTSGQLGNDLLVNQLTPVRTADFLSWSQVSSGGLFQCGIASGQAYCSGSGDSGRLGNGSTAMVKVPTPVNTAGVLAGKTLKQLDSAASGGFTCAVDLLNKAYCWGRGTGGQLGNGTATSSLVPVAVTLTNVRSGELSQVASGENHSCAISPDGRMYCTGFNVWGQLGTGGTQSTSVPVRVR